VLILLGVSAFVAVALLADRVLSKIHNIAELLAPALILMTFFQTLALLLKINVAWPPQLRKVLQYFTIINFNLELASPECTIEFDGNTRMNLVLATPVCLLLLICAYVLAKVAGVKCSKEDKMVNWSGLKRNIESMVVVMMIVLSTFFVKGVLGGIDCTMNEEDGHKYLDIEPEVECDVENDERYRPIRDKAVVGLALWCCFMGILTGLFLTKSGKKRFYFLTEKMEDRWYWWELLLMMRKVFIMAAGLFNNESPSRGWYLGSLVIILALTAHAFARPYKDPWVDACESVSLLATLLIFQGGMVWTVDPTGSLSHAIEQATIVLITLTCVLALYAQWRAYQLHENDGLKVPPDLNKLSNDELSDLAWSAGLAKNDVDRAMSVWKTPEENRQTLIGLIRSSPRVRAAGSTRATEFGEEENPMYEILLVTVVFEEPGPIGLRLGYAADALQLVKDSKKNTERTSEKPMYQKQLEILEIKTGTQAQLYKDLTVGLLLHSIDGTLVRGMSLKDVNKLLRDNGDRPLTIEFAPAPGDETTSRAGDAVGLSQLYDRVGGMPSAALDFFE
jgi:hypothetical protein